MIGPLSSSLLLPLLLAAVCVVQRSLGLPRWLALAGSLWSFGAGLMALASFAARPGGDFRFVESWTWSERFGAHFAVGVDGIGAAMLALSGLVTAVATIVAWREDRHPRAYHALVLLLLACVNGAFVALDLLVFYVCWEAVLLPMLALIGVFGGEQRRYAALKFFVYTLAGSVLMLATLILLWRATPPAGQRVAVPPAVVALQSADGGASLHGLAVRGDANGIPTVDVPRGFDVRHLALQWQTFDAATFLGVPLATFGFLALLLACLVKVPAIPLHTWLPHAHVQAPTAVSVLLAGVLLKLGVYGLYRLAWPLFPTAAQDFGPAVGALGTAGILFGAWVALGQQDLKRLVAYSSVSHMGFCLLGLASLTAAGAAGGMVQAVTHGLSSSLLFVLVGVVYDRVHHRRIDGLGGLARPMPRFSWLLLIGALAGAGLPGLGGFVGEFLVLLGGFTGKAPFPWQAALAVPSVVLSAAYLLWMVKRTAYGPLRHAEHAALPDCDARELWSALPLVIGLVVLGVWPGPLVDALRGGCDALLAHVQGVRP
jgi:NADH-quinone oxidoreductase subunit M